MLAGQQEASTLNQEQLAAQEAGYGQNAQQTMYNNSLIPQNISNYAAELGLGQEKAGYGLNLLNGVLTGAQVGMPSFPNAAPAGAAQTPQLLQAGQDQYQASLDAYNAQTGANNNMLSGLTGLAGVGANMYGSSNLAAAIAAMG